MKKIDFCLDCDISTTKKYIEKFAAKLVNRAYQFSVARDNRIGDVRYILVQDSKCATTWYIHEQRKSKQVGQVEISQVIPDGTTRLCVNRVYSDPLLGTNYTLDEYITDFYTCFYDQGLLSDQQQKLTPAGKTNTTVIPRSAGIYFGNVNATGDVIINLYKVAGGNQSTTTT